MTARDVWPARLLAASGLFFFGSDALGWLAGPPPRGAVVEWAGASSGAIAGSNELLAFAGALLAPGASAVARRLDGVPATVVERLLVATSALVLGLCVVQGRLVYPVYGLLVEDEPSAALVVALYFGGLHMVRLLLAAVSITASVSWWSREPALARLGLVTAALTVAASFPDAMPPGVALATQAAFPVWCIAVGSSRPASPGGRPGVTGR